MDKTASKPMPCPFCGGVPKVFQREHPAITHVPLAWIVQCVGCTAETCSEHRQWALDYWNRRATQPATQPVAYMYTRKGYLPAVRWDTNDEGLLSSPEWTRTPLYTHE